MTTPLNPRLYAALCRRYRDVRVVYPGVAIQWKLAYDRDLTTGRVRVSRKLERGHGGEEYLVKCRACNNGMGDHKPRLYFNHRWGVYDPETGSRNLWMAHCFNEECYVEFKAQVELYRWVFSDDRRGDETIGAGTIDESLTRVTPKKPPGPTISLEDLANRYPSHPALTYLTGRGFDPVSLSRTWGVGYCADSRYAQAANRIYIPVFWEDFLAGWQTRFIGDFVDGRPLKELGIEKYWTCPGMRRKLTAYNFHRAVTHSTVVVVEGPMDAWRVGPMAVATLGSRMSPALQNSLVMELKRRHTEPVVVVAFDPTDNAKRKDSDEHPIDELVSRLQEPLGNRVVPCYLPGGKDPGSMDRVEMREIFKREGAKRGIEVTFRPPTNRSRITECGGL